MGIRLRLNKTDDSAIEVSDVQEVVGLLIAGEAELDPFQNVPPFAVLEWLTDRTHNVSNFGEATVGSGVLSKVRSQVLAGNLKQSVVADNEIRWFSAGREAYRAVGACLSGFTDLSNDLYGQLDNILKDQLSNETSIFDAERQLTQMQMRQRRLVQSRFSRFAGAGYKYHQLSNSWFKFSQQIEALQGKRAKTVDAAFAEGRILASIDAPAGSSLLHPGQTKGINYWSKPRAKSRRHSISIFFSRDLPSNWFDGGSLVHHKRAQAERWMKRVDRHFSEHGKRVSNTQLVEGAQKLFSMTKNAAKDALRAASVSMKKQAGAIPEKQRVTLKEILEIN